MITSEKISRRQFHGDFIGIREWAIIYEMREEESRLDLAAIAEKVNHDRPIRAEVLS